jgi:hypothetical protein
MTRQQLAEQNEEMLFFDGFDAALIGTVTIFDRTVALSTPSPWPAWECSTTCLIH